MSLLPGSRLGPYEIVGRIGAGGMGEVWKARDPKLNRFVAIKVLPASFSADPDRLKRLGQEAKALAAISHPNLVHIFEAAEHEGAPFLVMELLEGETLRERLRGKSLPSKRTAEIAQSIACGLAAAHGKGILHRDLKPENIFLTRDGQVKVLDFGLAKFESAQTVGSEIITQTLLSEPGTILGTSGYMSPEQVRGEPLDARSDLFCLGIILWEMLAGRRPFLGDSSIEVMHAILREVPPEFDEALNVAPGLERIVRTCLEKEPASRFHSAHDLAFALDSLSTSGVSSQRFPALRMRRSDWSIHALGGAVVLLLLLLGLGTLAWLGSWPPFQPPKQPTFKRLTFRQGPILGARFSPDGREVIFDGAWDGGNHQIYATRLDTLEEKPLGIPGAALHFLTRAGDLGVALNAKSFDEFDTIGELAKAPLGGIAPKAILKDVIVADQAPDGRLAVGTSKDYPPTLEFPLGERRAKLTLGSTLRFSPDGRHLAFATPDHRVRVLDTATGQHRPLTRPYENLYGMAWKGNELWFTAGDSGRQQSLRAVTLANKERVILETPGRFRLLDVAEDGRALMAQEDFRVGILVWAPGQEKPRDITRADDSFLYSLARDGKRVVFAAKIHLAKGEASAVFLGSETGAPQLLSEGWYSVLSPDGHWVATLFSGKEPKVVLYPTGAGQERPFPLTGLKKVESVAWTLDGKSLLISEGGGRIFLQPLDGGTLHPLTPEGVANGDWGTLDLAPDGRTFLAKGPAGLGIYDLQDPTRPPTPLPAFEGTFLGWTADSKRFYLLQTHTLPLEVWIFDPVTGQLNRFRTFRAESLLGAGVLPWASRITADGSTLAVTYFQKPSTLYLVEGPR